MEWIAQAGSLYLQYYQWGGLLTTGVSLLSPSVMLGWWLMTRLRWRVFVFCLATFFIAGYVLPITYYWVNHDDMKRWTQQDYDDRCRGTPYTLKFIILCRTTRDELDDPPFVFAHSKLGALYAYGWECIQSVITTLMARIFLGGILTVVVAALLSRYASGIHARRAFDSFHANSATK